MPSGGYKIAQNYETAGSRFNRERFAVTQLLKELHTAQVVQVIEVFPAPPGDEKANIDGNFGFVHAELVIEQVDNNGRRVDMRPLFNLPYFRLQGGTASIVLDPKVDDFGLAVFCERDISLFKRTIAKCLPESSRFFSQSDGIYIGGILNVEPTVYVRLQDDVGVVIETTNDLPCNVHCKNATVAAESGIHLQTAGGYDAGGADFMMQGNKMWLYAKEINQRCSETWSEQPPIPTGGVRGPTMPADLGQ